MGLKKRKSKERAEEMAIIKAFTSATAIAAERTMMVMGYNTIVKDGWVVRKYQDGSIEKIKKLEPLSQEQLDKSIRWIDSVMRTARKRR